MTQLGVESEELPQFCNMSASYGVGGMSSTGDFTLDHHIGTSGNSIFIGGLDLVDSQVYGPGSRRIQQGSGITNALFPHLSSPNITIKEEDMATELVLRKVRIHFIDPDKHIPLEKRIIFEDEKVTDLNDQELFFEYPVKELLTKHNEYRKGLQNSDGHQLNLEPIRIKDLKMVVVELFKVEREVEKKGGK